MVCLEIIFRWIDRFVFTKVLNDAGGGGNVAMMMCGEKRKFSSIRSTA